MRHDDYEIEWHGDEIIVRLVEGDVRTQIWPFGPTLDQARLHSWLAARGSTLEALAGEKPGPTADQVEADAIRAELREALASAEESALPDPPANAAKWLVDALKLLDTRQRRLARIVRRLLKAQGYE